MEQLFSQVQVGTYTLPHRLAMAPMTRSRALEDGTVGPLTVEYYKQRASLGLLISEGTQPSEDGQGYSTTPGIYTAAHIDSWKQVTEAVHEAGGRLFIQLMHAGRISHPYNTPHGRVGVAPSAIAPNSPIYTPKGMQQSPVPRALSVEEIEQTVADFAHAAKCAMEAGADGVEIHGANGYLIHQFFAPNANIRTDEYGGSFENRARFGLQVAKAVVDAIGAERVGFRINVGDLAHVDIVEGEDNKAFYAYFIEQLSALNLAYLHVNYTGDEAFSKHVRSLWSNTIIVNRAGRPIEQISADIDGGFADIASIGAWALANPDFIERLKGGHPFNEVDKSTFFGGGAKGYTDYPTLQTV